MGETLEALHRLQEVELKLAHIRRNRDSYTRRIAIQNRQVKKADDKIQQMLLQARERQMRVDALSLEVASKEETAAKHREALNQAKTNKDYSAILTAMNTEKADVSKLESRVLELMEEINVIREEVVGLETEKEKCLKRVTDAEGVLSKFEAGCKDEQESLLADRKQCSDGIAPTTLASFTRVAEHHDGEAMASVTKIHPKRDEYICSGCNMTVTLEVVNSLQTRDDLQPCKTCGRILYFASAATSS